MNPLEYHVWGTVRGLSQAPQKPNMVAELKKLLQVIAQDQIEKAAKKLSKPVFYLRMGAFSVCSNNCNVVLLLLF